MSPTPIADEHVSLSAPDPIAGEEERVKAVDQLAAAKERLDGASPTRVEVLVNGEGQALPDGATVETLIANLGLGGRRVAVACNQRVVPRSSYDQPLVNGDRLEILEAVGGG